MNLHEHVYGPWLHHGGFAMVEPNSNHGASLIEYSWSNLGNAMGSLLMSASVGTLSKCLVTKPTLVWFLFEVNSCFMQVAM